MYTCIQSYRSIVGAKRFYTEGEQISNLDYDMLPEYERTYWIHNPLRNSVLSEELPSVEALTDTVVQINAKDESITVSSHGSNTVLAAVHSPEREKELQELCRQVLNASPERYYNPNGADETTCPFCYAKDYSTNCTADIEDIKHDVNCAYNIAKGLSTNS